MAGLPRPGSLPAFPRSLVKAPFPCLIVWSSPGGDLSYALASILIYRTNVQYLGGRELNKLSHVRT